MNSVNPHRTVSFQGSQLTSGQRLRLEQQSAIRSFISPVLQQQVSETLNALEDLKKSPAAPYKPEKQWFLESQTYGTPSVAEFMGY